jgi:hypothetical protein
VSTVAIEPRTGKCFGPAIASPDWHLWDNFGYVEGGVTHIYAQAAGRTPGERSEERYWRAYWRHFASTDDGRTWIDEGPALRPGTGPGVPDAKAIWSGSVTVLPNGRKLAAYTGLAAGRLALQSISLAVSDDGGGFVPLAGPRPLLSPTRDYDRLRDLGYYLGERATLGDDAAEADGTFMALRDPYLFLHGGRLHMLFGAKAMLEDTVVRAVGHAVIEDALGVPACELLAPIVLPDAHHFNQLELPNVIHHDGLYYLVISTNHVEHLGQSDLERQRSVRIYRSAALDTGWQPCGDAGRHVILGPESRLYGLNIIGEHDHDGDTVTCRAFWVDDTTLPPSLRLTIGGGAPRLERPQTLWAEADRRVASSGREAMT